VLLLSTESWLAFVNDNDKTSGLMMEGADRGTRRIVTAIVLAFSALSILGSAVVSRLPRPSDATPQKVLTRSDLVLAYSRVRPGLTRASQLSQYGFDRVCAGTQVLSYLGMMERVMPRDSIRFDRLDSAIKDCVAVRDHCTALIFRSADRSKPAMAHSLFTAFGLGADAAAATPRVTLLIRDGRVAFKTISGIAETTPPPDRQARTIPLPFRIAY
jgi:hypothetical protein